MTSVESPSTPDPVVDGATGEDDGGRDPGDVELMIFRRIRSLSNVSGRMLLRGPGEKIGRYFTDPLSMFSERQQNAGDSDGDEDSAAENENEEEGEDDDTQAEGGSSSTIDEADAAEAGLQHYVSHGIAWRDAMVQACADLLGKSIEQLDEEYQAAVATTPPQNLAFGTEVQSFEPVPRDLADYAIMTTLKAIDTSAMLNASSWLFNMMDRTGAGYVLREEFVRYAPFIGPVADAAVAGIVFDELVREQSRQAAEKEAESEEQERKDQRGRQSQRPNSVSWNSPVGKEDVRAKMRNTSDCLRRRRPRSLPPNRLAIENSSSQEVDGIADDGDDLSRSQPTSLSVGGPAGDGPSRDLFPPSVALRYDLWRPFFIAIQDKYHCMDDDWVHVKQELGIDACEVLMKSQGALDHSDVFPTLGKLYLSQRYLIFFAAVGRNHYVARLGAVADVTESAIPLMMRDSLKVHLESETKAAMDGISALQKDDPSESGTTADDSRRSKDADAKSEPTLSEHVGKLMRQYTAGRKPLQFSLLEFRETKRRDNWVNLIREMVAAHKLHVQLGFGSSGRAVPRVEQSMGSSSDTEALDDASPENEGKNREVLETRSLNYARSPFRNEPSPPLLAVAAHANIVRYRALGRVTKKHVSKSLLLFINAERNASLINWYTDSVRAYNNQSGRSWIERALAAIRENMDTNDRIYRVQDDEPFDVSKLGDAIGRFAELCSPLARVIQFVSHLFQWRNPPATILAILVCIAVAAKGWVNYVPACLIFLQAAWVVETRYNWLGLGMGRTESEDAERRQANVLELVAQVHDTLAAAQNVLGRLNRELGKVQALFLWGSEEWQSWVAVGFLCFAGLLLLLIPSRLLFLSSFFFLFFKHFLPPTNPGLKYWESIPSRAERKREESRSKALHRKRKPASLGRSGTENTN